MDIREKFRQRLNAPPSDLRDAAAKFLRIYCSDADSMQETRLHIARVASFNPRSALEGLAAIEVLLSTPQEAGFLAMLVAMEGNRQLADASDSGAAAWLHALGETIKEILQSVSARHKAERS